MRGNITGEFVGREGRGENVREGDGGECVKKKESGGNMTEKLWQKEGKCEI